MHRQVVSHFHHTRSKLWCSDLFDCSIRINHLAERVSWNCWKCNLSCAHWKTHNALRMRQIMECRKPGERIRKSKLNKYNLIESHSARRSHSVCDLLVSVAMHNSFILLFYCIWMIVRYIQRILMHNRGEYCLLSANSAILLNIKRPKNRNKNNKFQLIISCCAKNVSLFSCCTRRASRSGCVCVYAHHRCCRLRCSRRLLVPTPTVINLISVVAFLLLLSFDFCFFFIPFRWNHNENILFVENCLPLHISVLFVRHSQVIVI